MAKKGSRTLIGLICDICGSHNYVTEKNKINTTNILKLKKFCKKCRRHTVHKEKKKLG